MWKFWKRVPTYEEMNVYCGKQLPEEDPAAALQNADEVEFNKDNPTLKRRTIQAKQNTIPRLSKDQKWKLLEKDYLDESVNDIDIEFGDKENLK